MKTRELFNPQVTKTSNPNDEPWLTKLELLFEIEAAKKSYSKWN